MLLLSALASLDLAVELFGSDASEPSSGAAFLALLAFLLSFVLVRINTRLIRSGRFSWWPGNLEIGSGLHVHHLLWGISLLLLCGFLAFATDLEAPWWQITAVGFGIGAGLTLDEFALWLHLEDVYWADEGRSSIDAVVIAALFAVLVVLGVRPWGLDDAASVIGTIAVLVACLSLASVIFLKGRLALGVLALFVPLVGVVGAVRLAKPNSPWAHRFYAERRPERLERAQRRFRPERRAAVIGRRVQDLIGGTPTE